MKTWKVLLPLAVALAAAGCSREAAAPGADALKGVSPDVKAVLGEAGTRTTLGEYGCVLWSTGDSISVFLQTADNRKYVLDGEGGQTIGTFKFAGGSTDGEAVAYNFGVYPYNEENAVTSDGYVQVRIPDKQEYAEGGFANGMNVAVAASEDRNLTFKNVCGYIKIPVYGEGVKVKVVSLLGQNEEHLSGLISLEVTPDGDPAFHAEVEEGLKEVYIRMEEPLAIGATADEATDLWLMAIPQTLSTGFEVSILAEDAEGNEFLVDQRSSEELEIQRSKVSVFPPLELKSEESAIKLTVDMIHKIEVPATATSVELPYTANKEVTVTARPLGFWRSLSGPKDLTANPLVATFDANVSNSDNVAGFEFTFTDADGNSVTRLVTIIQKADVELAVEASHDHIVFDKETSSVVVTFTGNKDFSIYEFNVRGRVPGWMRAKRLDNWEENEPIMVVFYPEPNTTSEVRTGQFWIEFGVNEPLETVVKAVTFEQAPGAQAEPTEYTFSVPNTTIKVNNAVQFVHVPFISTDILSYVEIVDCPSWISTTSQAPMTLVVGANKAEDATERNAQVNYIYTDPKGIEHTGSFRICQSATKNIE